jgi:hypothetical protein
MINRVIKFLLLVPLSVGATPPPRPASFETKVCQATHIFVGHAADFTVVPRADCPHRGDGKSLSFCEDVQVSVAISKVVRPNDWNASERVIFRFGGGLFSIDNLRNDLLGKPRYFFTTVSVNEGLLVHRTSYEWFLGAEFNPVTENLVTDALKECVASPALSRQ